MRRLLNIYGLGLTSMVDGGKPFTEDALGILNIEPLPVGKPPLVNTCHGNLLLTFMEHYPLLTGHGLIQGVLLLLCPTSLEC